MINKIVLDIETQKSFSEVGGRNRNHLLRVSVAVAYSYPQNKFLVFEEKGIHKLGELLQEADMVIGYNIKDFDYAVLQPYYNFDLQKTVPTLDMLAEVEKLLGHRISLDSIAEATLNVNKIASGMDAIRFWREGDIKKLTEYCVSDVRITRDLYEYAAKNRKLFYKDFFNKKEIRISFPEFQVKQDKRKQISLF